MADSLLTLPLDASAALSPEEVLARLRTRKTGLTSAEAQERLATVGFNTVATERREWWVVRLLRTCANPLIILLAVLSIVSLMTGDAKASSVMAAMIVIGVLLRFVQESRADTAAARLKAMIQVTTRVLRDGAAQEIELRGVVPGDIVLLTAGDMIPGDLRLLATKDLYVNQSSVTGESLPVEKSETIPAMPLVSPLSPFAQPAHCFLGTSVQSGTATGVVVATGKDTQFGRIAGSLARQRPPTAFDRGIDQFSWLMIRFVAVMAPLVFVINGMTKHGWREAFFFALAVGVGLTPEMLPMIVSVCLTQGALAMSKKRVIVRRLDTIQNIGAMDVLCTDKTGTLTRNHVILERHCDATGQESDRVYLMAFLVSYFQTGLRNVLDQAILASASATTPVPVDGYRKIDEIPFDFTRQRMSVIVETPSEGRLLIVKGSAEHVLAQCATFEVGGERVPVEQCVMHDARAAYTALSTDGFRVLAVAYRAVPERETYTSKDEAELTLCGYVAFLDPPKETAHAAIEALQHDGIAVKTLTGDNALVTRKICADVGISVDHVLLGSDIEAMSDAVLQTHVDHVSIFAELSPIHKQRIIGALQRQSHVVGFLGDGINDAPALHDADVGISVDSAVDVAKATADIVLLEKSLLVVHEGVVEGRKVFANALKYLRMGASSNFGNMLSVVGASVWLPFLPMAPIQILTNNLLYDISQIPIPTDHVDAEQLTKPRPWSVSQIRRFILCIGPISSIFDYTTFAVMYFVFGASTPARAHLFQTGWFVESLVTQTLIIHVIRTQKIPFLQSRPSIPLAVTTSVVLVIGLWLPISPFAGSLGLVRLPGTYWPFLAATVVAYLALTQIVKMTLLRARWIA